MELRDRECVCKEKWLSNVDGNCVCAAGKYLIEVDALRNESARCSACPLNCLTCTSINNLIQCTSCDTNQTNRENIFQSGCPCKEGYS